MRCGGHDELVTSRGVSPVECFGNTVGRGGIDLEVRELLTVSMLVALGGADAQVRGLVNGNLRVGNARARLLAVLSAGRRLPRPFILTNP